MEDNYGIFNKSFITFIENNLGKNILFKTKNIICPCPWCEFGLKRDHYHCYISLESPLFHCFYAGCEKGGHISKFIKKIDSRKKEEEFIDNYNNRRIFSVDDKKDNKKEFLLPEIDTSKFIAKQQFLKRRFGFPDIPIKDLKGLILDFEKFLKINNIKTEESFEKFKYFLQNNFIGFITDNHSIIVFRNIDSRSTFRFYKYVLYKYPFFDYFSIRGGNPYSNKIIIAEGIFDIYSEWIYDSINERKNCLLYVSALSSKFSELIKNIMFSEDLFNVEVIVLSDKEVTIDKYKYLKKILNHVIKKLTVYYNTKGKDFNSFPIIWNKNSV